MPSPPPSSTQTTCGSLLKELQKIWDEIGESDSERDRMLLQLEQECLDIYRRKVDRSRKYKADLHQALADAEAELAGIVAAIGERVSFTRGIGPLKEQLATTTPVLEDLRLRKQERVRELSKIQSQIVHIRAEIAGHPHLMNSADALVNERDLTLKKLEELKSQLQELQNEKMYRLQKVNSHISTIHELSNVMSLDFNEMLTDVHPSFIECGNGQSKNISNDTLARLIDVINSLKQEKEKRLQKLKDLRNSLLELWDLMDTPFDEQKKFEQITCLISADDLSSRGCLAMDVIEQTENEVQRLNSLKASKIKELLLKKQNELEAIYREVHMDVDSDTAREILISIVESGDVDLSGLLSSMDDQIVKAKVQATSRKDILDKVDKWKHAAEEENWLDEYERDDNRYSAGRGAHKNLKRAEKARTLVGKIPSLVENLTAKVKAWEIDKGIPFLYDKAPLLQTLDEYMVQRREREEEKRRSREQKRLQEQFATEQEALFGSRPSAKKPLGQSLAANTTVGTPVSRRATTPSSRYGISGGKDRRDSAKVGTVIPVNYVALPKDDSASRGS